MNPTEFANKIRQKYPGAYDNVPDDVLTQKVIAKYPVYSSQVKLPSPAEPSFLQKVGGVAGAVGNALISSERKVGEIAGQSAAVNSKDFDRAQQSALGLSDMQFQTQRRINEKKALGEDTSRLEATLAKTKGRERLNIDEIAPASQSTNLEAAGALGGVALDLLAVGSLKGGKGFALAPKLTKTVAEVAKAKAAYSALSTGAKVASIAKQTAKTAATGATIGYGYDVALKAQNNELDLKPGLGTVLGAGIPSVIGGAKIVGAITKDQAPRIINSLIGTRKGDFSFGKNPGRAISQEGIVGNSLPDFENKVTQARQKAGSTIGEITSKLEGKAKVQIVNSLSPIDEAIAQANKSPRTNATLIQRLENVKADLIGSRNLSDPSFGNAFDLKSQTSDLVKWTGNQSDDNIVNNALKRVYGNIKDSMNEAAIKADPSLGNQLMKANERYADFSSAQVALRNRIALNQGKNLMSMPAKIGTIAGVITGIATGTGIGIPAVLAGVAAGVLDKALGSTAVKTRIASWLAKESPQVVAEIVQKNPGIGGVLKKAFSKEYTPIENALKDIKTIPGKQGGYISAGGKKIKEIAETTKQEIYDTIKYIDSGKMNKEAEETLDHFIKIFEISPNISTAQVKARLLQILDKTKTKTVLNQM